MKTIPPLRAPLVALATSLGLILVYVAFGGGSYEPNAVADPCESRPEQILAERAPFESIALSALDGAACELGVSREELTLALADRASTQRFADARGIESEEVDDAVRAGLQRAVADARNAGRIGALAAVALDRIVEYAPVGAILQALQSVSSNGDLRGLLGELWQLGEQGLPGLDGLPRIDQLPDIDDLGDLDQLLP